jgi:hypothetical protein
LALPFPVKRRLDLNCAIDLPKMSCNCKAESATDCDWLFGLNQRELIDSHKALCPKKKKPTADNGDGLFDSSRLDVWI